MCFYGVSDNADDEDDHNITMHTLASVKLEGECLALSLDWSTNAQPWLVFSRLHHGRDMSHCILNNIRGEQVKNYNCIH